VKSLNLLPILTEIRSRELSQAEIRSFYCYCTTLCRKILYQEIKSRPYLLNSTAVAKFDVCFDAVTPLFIKSGSKSQSGLQRALQLWQSPITDERDAGYFLYKIVSARLSQELTGILKKENPHFTSVLRSIEYQGEKNNFSKFTVFGTTYISRVEVTEHPHLLEEDEFLASPLFPECYSGKNNLLDVYECLRKEYNREVGIPLNVLVKRLVKVSVAIEKTIETNYSETNLHLEESMSRGLDLVTGKLSGYLKANKINITERDMLSRVVSDMARDLADGGANRGYFEYVKNYDPLLEKADFETKYRSILDYLVKFLKQSLATQLTEK